MTQHKTRRGELMAKLNWKKTAAGRYIVEGYDVIMRAEASGSRPGRWEIINVGATIVEVPSLTAALQSIDTWIIEETAVSMSVPAPQTETISTEVEIVDETPEPVTPEVPTELIVTEIQEDIAPVAITAPRKTRPAKTRRTELLTALGARTVGTAEYDVAGHHVEYVAPGVMPRGAGGRWRTTLMTASGVVTNWNLSLTAALEVVERRVNEALAEGSRRIGESLDKSSNVRRYVAVYPSVRKDVDLCELHAPGCADLSRTGKHVDPQVDVTLDITDEDATMLVLDPDQLGYDVHAVKVMSCAQHAPLAENANA